MAAAGCENDIGPDDTSEHRVVDTHSPRVTFEFIHYASDESFFASTRNDDVIRQVRDELSLPYEERSRHVSGYIAKGPSKENEWNWHFIDERWEMTNLSIELCDGWPSYVSENIDEWLKENDQFCPWKTKAVRESVMEP